jgi:phage shock protein A
MSDTGTQGAAPDGAPDSDGTSVVEGEIAADTSPELGAAKPAADYTGSGVPTFDYVRDRIEGRFATSTGAAELADDAALDEQLAEREQAGRDKLEQIRRSMRGE